MNKGQTEPSSHTDPPLIHASRLPQISVMQEMLASLGPQIEEAAEGVSNMMQLIEQVGHYCTVGRLSCSRYCYCHFS